MNEKQIRQLREQGKKLGEIAKITGKSIYYVYCRLNPNYRVGKLESSYITEKVIPYLEENGFTDIELELSKEGFNADIIAKKEGAVHLFEVKKNAQNSSLCFAIGEIIINRRVNEKIAGKKAYHIVLPHSNLYDRFNKEKSRFLKEKYDMDIILI